MRRVLGLLAAFLSLAIVMPAAVMAASGITLGPADLNLPGVTSAFPSANTIVQVGAGSGTYAAPQSGTITRWSYYAPVGGGEVTLVVLHDTGCQYKVVAESSPQITEVGINEFSANLPIAAGDYIGVRSPANTFIRMNMDNVGTYQTMTELGVGQSASFVPSEVLFLFNALMTPDAGPSPDPEPQPAAQPSQPVVMNAQVTNADGQRTANPAASPMTAGTAFGLTGANMNLAESVYFNNVPAKTWWIDGFEKLTVVVPAGLPEGPVQVRVGGVAGVTEDTPSTTVFITRGGQIATVAEASQSPVTRTAGKAKPARKVKPNRSKTKQSRKVARLTDGGGVHGAC